MHYYSRGFVPEDFDYFEPYRALKAKHPGALLLAHVDGYYVAYDQDADILIDVCGLMLRELPGGTFTTFWHTFLEQDLAQLAAAGHTNIVFAKRAGEAFVVTDPPYLGQKPPAPPEPEPRPRRPRRVKPQVGQGTLAFE